jgi:two-component sensor histidine kinase
MQRLLRENARLNSISAQSQGMAARYALLLREGEHRIKNSLQVVASVLSVQARRETNAATRDALQAATARIRVVARIHDALQMKCGDDLIDIGALIATMSRSLHAMAGDRESIMISVNAEPIEASLAIAQPIALAVNELIINALRHAFPDDREGAIVVTISQCDDQVRIVVADDGAGLPVGYCDGRGGYGMSLVRAMVEKVGGRLDVQNADGARFTLSAPLSLSSAKAPRHYVPDQIQTVAVG